MRTRPDTASYARRLAFNEASGELEGILVQEDELRRAQGRAKKTFGEPFAVLFQAGAARIAARKDLTLSDHRVFLALISRASQENPVFDSDPRGLAALLGMNVGQVARSLRTLGATGLIERPFHGKVALNPTYAWRGTSEQRAKYRKESETFD